MKTEVEIEKVDNLVRVLLEKFPVCRNCDKLLTFKVMQHFTGQTEKESLVLTPNNFSEMPAFESVKRCRAKIQNEEHKYLPTDPKVRLQRHIREEDFRKWSTKPTFLF